MDGASRKSKRALPTHVLDKKVTIVTLGLGNFEIGDKSHRKCFAVRNWCRTHSVGQGSSQYVDSSRFAPMEDDGHAKMMVKSLRANYPDILEGLADHEIVLDDCRALSDAAESKDLRVHIGIHPDNVRMTVLSSAWRQGKSSWTAQ